MGDRIQALRRTRDGPPATGAAEGQRSAVAITSRPNASRAASCASRVSPPRATVTQSTPRAASSPTEPSTRSTSTGLVGAHRQAGGDEADGERILATHLGRHLTCVVERAGQRVGRFERHRADVGGEPSRSREGTPAVAEGHRPPDGLPAVAPDPQGRVGPLGRPRQHGVTRRRGRTALRRWSVSPSMPPAWRRWPRPFVGCAQ